MTQKIKQRIEQIRRGEVPLGYKKTKIGITPREWKLLHFKNLFDRHSLRNSVKNTNVLTISAQHGLISQNDFFNKEIASEDKTNYYLLNFGEFAFNKSYSKGYPFGAIKRLKYYDKGIVSPLYICFNPKENNVCPEFYEHYFEAGLLNREICAFAQEGARNHGLLNIGVDDFFNTYIISPQTIEQQKIASILTTCDKVIELKEKLIAEKQRQKKWLMQNLLTGKRRLAGFVDEWKQIHLKDITVPVNRKNSEKIERVLTVSGKYGLIDQTDFFSKSVSAENIEGYYHLKNGEFAYNRSSMNDFPFGAIKRLDMYDDGALSTLYICFELRNECCSDYWCQYFSSASVNHELYQIIQVGARAHGLLNITLSDFYNIILRSPAISEQTAIAAILSTADREIELLQQELDQYKQQKKALMQLLLTGIVRVNM